MRISGLTKKIMLRGVIGLLFIGLVLSVTVNSGTSFAKAGIKWSPMTSRLLADTYQLPAGAKEAVAQEGVKKIVAYNWGDLAFDPATVLNGKIFKDLTGVDIEFVGLPDEQMYPKLQAVFMAKSPAVDVVPLDATLYVAFAKAGWLEPLDYLWDNNAWKEFSPGLKKALTVDGHVYSTPQCSRIVTALFYRPSMLKAAGFDAPPKTWDEFDAMAKKLTKDTNGDGVIDQWGYAFSGGGVQDGAYSLMSSMYLLGEKLIQNNGKIKVNSKGAIKALDRLVKMRNEWKVVPPSVTAYQHGDTQDLFKGGKVAMLIEPTSFFSEISDKKSSAIADDIAIAPQPVAYKGGPATNNLEINMWGVSRFSKAKNTASLFCDYYHSKQAAVNEFTMECNEPWMFAVLNDSKVKSTLNEQYLNVVKEALKDTRTEVYADQGLANKIIIREMQNALTGQKTAKKALDDAQAEIDQTVNKKN
ncbi:MAG: ABC transporter substrate-binding protein [Bacillota bacterium]